MKGIFEKINKNIDIITDTMVELLPAVNETKEYKYSDLVTYVKKMRSKHPKIQKFVIVIDKNFEYAEKVYASERFIIRIVMLTEDGCPIIADKKSDEYLGTIIISESIDTKLKEKMAGKAKQSFVCSRR